MTIKIVFVLITSVTLINCNTKNSNNKVQELKQDTLQSSKQTVPVADMYKNMHFDNKKDFSCGMPVSASVKDTVQYKGKLYGFCAKECKDDFLKDPEGHLAAKQN
jgi:YHS domain-containing protein